MALSLEQQAMEALARGAVREALRAWLELANLHPEHLRAQTQSGMLSLRLGDFAGARAAFERAAALDERNPRAWINVAVACQKLRDGPAEAAALTRALTIDPYDLSALLMRGEMHERNGRRGQAASAYGAAATVAPPMHEVPPDLRPRLAQAMRFRARHQQALSAFMDQAMQPVLQEHDAAASERFRLSLDILLGRKRRYDSQPLRFFVPQLRPAEFFPRERFPWLEALEAATDDIRSEFLNVLAQEDDSFVPYITYGADEPVAQWAELNHSPRWSVLHLVKDGRRVDANADRCPRTMAAWSQVPAPQQPGRTPVLLFSLLKPRTRIPPHVGASNARLLTHLPLIVPPGCSFRVGNTRREWVPGQAWVFDDTVEHEAWNDSDQLRVIVIFDIWHPDLTPDEQRLIGAMNEALNAFSADDGGDYDV